MSHPGRFEPRRRARRRSLQALYAWYINPKDIGDVLAQFREEQDFSNVDGDFFEALVRGVVQGQGDLDTKLAEFLDRPGEQLDVMEKVILQMGAWELLNHPETPLQVVLDECVELARRFGAEQGHAYINGVLDKAARHWRPAEPGSGGSSA